MRFISIFLALLLIGAASAQWYPRSADINTTGDINADNGVFSGNLTVTGIGTFTGGTVNGGVYDGNFRMAANHSFYSTTGSGGIDWSNATGIFKTPTGQHTFAGDINQAAGKDYIQLTGDGKISVGTGGLWATDQASPLYLVGDPRAQGNVSIEGYTLIDGATKIGGLMTANTGRFNSTVGIAGGISADSYAYINGSSKIRELDINLTLGVKGATDLDSSLDVAGASRFNGVTFNTTAAFSRAPTFAVANQATATVYTATSDVSYIGVDASGGNQTITLPDAATNAGRVYTVFAQIDPGANYLRINATGGDHVGSNDYYVTTEFNAFASFLSIGGTYCMVGGNTSLWSAHA